MNSEANCLGAVIASKNVFSNHNVHLDIKDGGINYIGNGIHRIVPQGSIIRKRKMYVFTRNGRRTAPKMFTSTYKDNFSSRRN